MVDKIKIFVFRFTIDPQLLLSSNFSMSIVPYYQLFAIMGNLKILLKASIWTTLVVGVLENPDQFWTLWNPESEIRNRESWALESMHLKESGSYKRLESRIQVPLTKNPESSTWNRESTEWNPESWALKSMHLKESGSYKRLESRIQVPLTKNPESSTWNLESTAWNPESKTVLDSLTWGDS